MLIPFCISCNKQLQEGIFNDQFGSLFIQVVLPILILVPLLIIYFRSIRSDRNTRTPVIIFSGLIGIGLGGFLDGIILHQLLQWHQMISNRLLPLDFAGKSINMFWDGVFESVTWIFTVFGVALMWHSRRYDRLSRSGHLFTGGLIAGWGTFNLMDSLNHFVFRLHNVREQVPDPEMWNWGFLWISIGFVAIGAGLMKRSERDLA